jgi:HEPN domain-containing protein
VADAVIEGCNDVLRRRYIRAEAERLVEYAAKIIRFCEGLLPTLEP